MSGSLDGRVALVTGGGGGIGAAICRRLAAEGACVVVNDRGTAVDGTGADSAAARGVVAQIEADGGRAVANGSDVTDHAAAGELVRQALDSFGRLDVVVTAAGILRDRMLFNMTADEWRAVLGVHLDGTFNVAHHASRHWREQANPEGHYRLITFTSVAGLHGAPGQPNYATAKLGIVGFTYSCAHALKRYGVTANSISPGAATRMTASVPDERRRNRADRPAAERSPDNIAPVVAYLAGERSDWCTGQVLSASGYQIGLYSRPQVIRQVVSADAWRLDEAGSLMEKAFRPVVENQPALYD